MNRSKFIGIGSVVFSLVLLGGIFYPALKEEIRYSLSKPTDYNIETRNEADGRGQAENIIIPADEQFGIIIPKISANAKVIAEVDPEDPAVYQRALTRGVAHARGTSYPGEAGNVFIFAHSSADFFEASRYNAVFYLLSKLESGDEVYLIYQGEKFKYKVSEKKTAAPEEAGYLTDGSNEEKLTLMTCWPPGTTLKRLIIIAKPSTE